MAHELSHMTPEAATLVLEQHRDEVVEVLTALAPNHPDVRKTLDLLSALDLAFDGLLALRRETYRHLRALNGGKANDG